MSRDPLPVMDEEDTLVHRRSKRSTAGNRMEAALAELALEEAPADVEDDIDFVGQEDEAEVFDSDFQSTDEEATQAGDLEENLVQDEKRLTQRLARQRTAKAIAVSAARQRVTFEPVPSTSEETPKRRTVRTRRRVSLGVAVDAETGRVVESTSKRKSRRHSTVLNSQGLRSRLKDAEARKASMPKKTKDTVSTFTQAELIQLALDNEEGNILDHRDYLSKEEEKRRRARVVRQTVSGPVLRWISRTDHEKVPVAPEPFSPAPGPGIAYTFAGNAYQPQQAYPFTLSKFAEQYPSMAASTAPPDTPLAQGSNMASSSMFKYRLNQFLHDPNAAGSSVLPSLGVTPEPTSAPALVSAASPPQAMTPAQDKTETKTVTKCFVVHELDQRDDAPKPAWDETMTAMFGTHVDWANVKVYSSKHRPLSRPVAKCPITGRSAPYRDPRTSVPFASVDAYKVLSRVLKHEYVWNEGLGCYSSAQSDLLAGSASH